MDRENRFMRNLAISLLLALVCMAAVGLVTCRFADPDLYDRIVTPVRHLYHGGRAQVKQFSEDYADWLARQEVSRGVMAEAQRLRAEERRREREERRLLKRMAKDEAEILERLKDMQVATAPLYEGSGQEDPAVTEFISRDGQEYLTGGNLQLPYYNQGEAPWADLLFGQDPVAAFGCGPTALAMLVSGLTGETVTPADMAAWAGGAGYSAPGSGAYLSIVWGTARHYNLRCKSLTPLTADRIQEGLETGGIVVALMGPGHFTARGHFILLRGMTETGEILVADPNSRENSLSVWNPVTIATELSASRTEGAPLWLILPPEAAD